MTTMLNPFVRYGRHFAIFTVITMGATQCADTSDGRLAQGQGTAIGAGAGALIGAAFGGRQGALIGAAIGGASGFAYGSHIANKKAQYRSTEDWLDACIAQANSKRREAVSYNHQLENKLASLQREVKVAAAAKDRVKLASLKREIGTERAAAQKQAAVFGKEAELQHSAIKQAGGQGGSRLSSLRESTNGIETQVSVMNKNVQRYASLESQTDV
ncbi:MAG: YMGG-like glycine zipper-containing protein [Verrucomicrobiota bacterium]